MNLLTLSTSYQQHTQMCITMTERMSEEDTGTLVIITSDQKITMSSKVMQMFSPLFKSLVADTSSIGGSDKEPMTVILTDYNSKMMLNLMNALMYGELVVVDKEQVAEVEYLAKSLVIRMNLGPNSSFCRSFMEDSSVVSKSQMRSTNRENFEESSGPKEELEEMVSLGHDADYNSNVSKDQVQVSDGGNSSACDQPQEDTSSHNPARSSRNDIDIEDLGLMSEDEDMMKEEAFKEYESMQEGEFNASESENEDESEAKKDEDHELYQNDAGSPNQPDHAGAKDENFSHDDDCGHCRVLRQRRKPIPVPGSHSMTPPPSCSTIRSKRRSTTEKSTLDRVTKKSWCRICHMEFSSASTVWRHIKTVHEGLRYPCPHASCGKTFSQVGHLGRHIKFAH